jgi:hypothetical protein
MEEKRIKSELELASDFKALTPNFYSLAVARAVKPSISRVVITFFNRGFFPSEEEGHPVVRPVNLAAASVAMSVEMAERMIKDLQKAVDGAREDSK